MGEGLEEEYPVSEWNPGEERVMTGAPIARGSRSRDSPIGQRLVC